MSKTISILKAEAPILWGRQIDSTNDYELNPEYHAINRIAYRWKFTPRGDPPGRHAAELLPANEMLTFGLDNDGADPFIQFQGALPAILDLGNYWLILRVEDRLNGATGHEVSRAVVIIP